MSNTALPPGWALTTIADIVEPIAKTDPAKWAEPADLVYYDIGGIDNHRHRVQTHQVVTSDRAPSRARQIVRPGDVLFSTVRTYLENIAVVPEPPAGALRTLASTGFCVLRARDGIDPRFLYYRVLAADVLSAMKELQQGTSYPAIRDDDLKNFAVALPPGPEQVRIADDLERRVAHLQAAERSIQSAFRKVKAAKASVHEAAATGALLPAIDPTTWELVTAGDVTDVRGGIQKQPKRLPTLNKYPFLRVANVGRGVLDLTDIHEIELFGDELSTYRLQAGDLLVVEGNGSVDQIGRAARWDEAIVDCVHQNHLIRVRPGERVDSHFLELVWNAPSTIAQLVAVASSTSGLHTLSTGKIKAIQLRVPDLPTQRALVTEAARRLSLLESAERSIAKQLARCSAARSSILTAAFNGDLVPQDPSDEPAEAMLKRMEEQRAAGAPPKRTSRRPRAKKETTK